MVDIPGLDTILKAADLISDVRKAFSKIENLEQGERRLVDTVDALDKRVRELEAGLREARADIKLEAVKETQSIVNSVQGQIYQKISEVSVQLERLERGSSNLIGGKSNQDSAQGRLEARKGDGADSED